MTVAPGASAPIWLNRLGARRFCGFLYHPAVLPCCHAGLESLVRSAQVSSDLCAQLGSRVIWPLPCTPKVIDSASVACKEMDPALIGYGVCRSRNRHAEYPPYGRSIPALYSHTSPPPCLCSMVPRAPSCLLLSPRTNPTLHLTVQSLLRLWRHSRASAAFSLLVLRHIGAAPVLGAPFPFPPLTSRACASRNYPQTTSCRPDPPRVSSCLYHHTLGSRVCLRDSKPLRYTAKPQPPAVDELACCVWFGRRQVICMDKCLACTLVSHRYIPHTCHQQEHHRHHLIMGVAGAPAIRLLVLRQRTCVNLSAHAFISAAHGSMSAPQQTSAT